MLLQACVATLDESNERPKVAEQMRSLIVLDVLFNHCNRFLHHDTTWKKWGMNVAMNLTRGDLGLQIGRSQRKRW